MGHRILHDQEADRLGLAQNDMHMEVLDTETMGNEKLRTVADATDKIMNLDSGSHGNHHEDLLATIIM